MDKFIQKVKKTIENEMPVETDIRFTTPPDPELGDIALPCFPFVKIFRKSPNTIAYELKNKIEDEDFIEKVDVEGSYLNIYLKRHLVIKNTIENITDLKEKYGSSSSGLGKGALIEHTSINPNASPHVGRARNALIGDTIARVLEFEGYKVDVNYFVNDIGKQIAMLVVGVEDMENITFQDLLKHYGYQ